MPEGDTSVVGTSFVIPSGKFSATIALLSDPTRIARLAVERQLDQGSLIRPRVVLVNPPWASPTRPSISLGILSSICDEEGAIVKTEFANLRMAAKIGLQVAELISREVSLYGLSEHLFATYVFDRAMLDSDAFIDTLCEVLRRDPANQDWASVVATPDFLMEIRDRVIPDLIEDVATNVLESSPHLLGLTATFNQSMAALAIAKRVKERDPQVICICGGACFDDEMGKEHAKHFGSFVDHFCLGEGEVPFREILARMSRGVALAGVPGLTSVALGGHVTVEEPKPLLDLSESPRPNYDPYFEEKKEIEQEVGEEIEVEFIPFESSRGCWWGVKSHCMFCGINPDVLDFRTREIGRVVEDIQYFLEKYQVRSFMATDWILARAHVNTLPPALEELSLDVDLFYEVRADMTKEQIRSLRRAGVRTMQPGIESFSSKLLEHMGKHTTGLRQVQFIKWCTEFGVEVLYNILYGFPGEKKTWYDQMERIVDTIPHLQPPIYGMHPVEMHRFAPLYRDRAKFGIHDIRLRADYRGNYPADSVNTEKIGYFFEFSSKSMVSLADIPELREKVEIWRARHATGVIPVCEYHLQKGSMQIYDTRFGSQEIELHGTEQAIVLLSDKVGTVERLRKQLGKIESNSYGVVSSEADTCIANLLERNLILKEGNQIISVVTAGDRVRSQAEIDQYLKSNCIETKAVPSCGQ